MSDEVRSRLVPFAHLIVACIERRYEQQPQELHCSLDIQLVGDLRLIARDYYFSNGTRKYSFHVQDSNNNLVFRYDNEPHWNELPGFPYHKHLPGSVEPSAEMTLEMVLAELKKIFF
jgi:Family of unknown function (DUF6516)